MKLPAYSKRIVTLRRGGEHFLCVHLIFGSDWRDAGDCVWTAFGRHQPRHEKICILPGEYLPGQFNFAFLAGLAVSIFDQDCLATIKDGPVFQLGGEIAAQAGIVHLHSPAWAVPRGLEGLAQEARIGFLANNPEQNHGWPAWWSEEIERLHGRRGDTWIRAFDQEVDRRQASVG